jgi:hypothetical protein
MSSHSQKTFSKDFSVNRLRKDAQYHLRASVMRHPMKTKRVTLYKKLFASEDPTFQKDFLKAKKEWKLLHPGKGRPSIYRVRTGDTLETVAAKGVIYGDPRYWRILLKANTPAVKNPNMLPWGLILRIPPVPSDMGNRQHSALGEGAQIFSFGSKGNGHVD